MNKNNTNLIISSREIDGIVGEMLWRQIVDQRSEYDRENHKLKSLNIRIH